MVLYMSFINPEIYDNFFLNFMCPTLHGALNLNKEARFYILCIFLEPVVQIGWNLKWSTFSQKPLKWNAFQGQKGHMKASWMTFWPLFRIFYENSKRPIKKLPVFEKKKFKKICSKASSLYLNSQLHGQFSLELPIRFTPNLNHMANFTQAFFPWKNFGL